MESKIMGYLVQIESRFLMFRTVFSSFRVKLLCFVSNRIWIYVMSTTLIVYPLNSIDTNYSFPEITFFICFMSLSTHYFTFEILF